MDTFTTFSFTDDANELIGLQALEATSRAAEQEAVDVPVNEDKPCGQYIRQLVIQVVSSYQPSSFHALSHSPHHPHTSLRYPI
ncbi:hypothetical protein CVT24_001964 [Panaeolus cyanescens]|uniref:Uncharacterized protein n=1 Tax=Panaeolus cyanescens TaxID=181874 RepID=A0A409YHN9_9AGAR|nr:hypothetical protein CVT24_001964 [Panaeolus cyanescens]